MLIGNGLTAKSLGFLETHLQRASLKALDLNLYANKIRAEGAEIVAKAIKSQKHLDTLGLDLYFNNITEVGTQAICDSIDEIKTASLKTLSLNFILLLSKLFKFQENGVFQVSVDKGLLGVLLENCDEDF